MSLPVTEARNPRSMQLDTLTPIEIVALINEEDARVAGAVKEELAAIARAVDVIVPRLKAGGRLFYFGAGTSGRMGVLDASELPPTFSIPPERVQAYIAGGDRALRRSVEKAEDDYEGGKAQVYEAAVSAGDVVVGITASGYTPWVLGVLAAAKAIGAPTIALTCNPESPVARQADFSIAPVVGPEVITGSSRMKAGTAQKMVLNMLSTATMVRLGKVYGNLMVDLQTTNRKLQQRAERILQEATGLDVAEAQRVLEAAGGEIKTALVMVLAGVTATEARTRLQAAAGAVRQAIAGQDAVDNNPAV